MAKRRASKPTAKKSAAKKSTRKGPNKPAAKKASTISKKKSAARKPTNKAVGRKGPNVSKRAPRKKPAPPPTAYERRDKNARAKGYQSYWDERQSRVRSRKALNELGASDPSIEDVDMLGTLGRGESARELYYKTKRLMEKYEPAPTDRQIWALIRIFYKPRSRR